MTRKLVFSFFVALSLCGCGSSTHEIYAEKYSSDFPRSEVQSCLGIAHIFGGETVENELAPSNCTLAIGKKFDFICAYSGSLNEDNDWEFDSEVLESNLTQYKDAKFETIFEAKTSNESASPISIIGLAHDEIVWLDLIGRSPYGQDAVPTLIIDDGERGIIETSFLGKVTCIETRNTDAEIGLKFGFPF